ncbi:PAS domain-containing protein [Paucihalobacter sp.]|uniref:PAS domain-containing protein n=1 Tax=Paucihalobacter sp. TaxID=2850405 RepID=UPI002FE0311E
MIKTKEQLIFENENLRSCLNEMEETLEAIRNGEVDAVIVSGKNGQQIYSVSTAEAPYRTFIEQMSEGAVTLAKDGTILFCNQRFANIVSTPHNKVIGAYIKDYITPNDTRKLDNFLAELTYQNHDVIIVTLKNAVHLRMSIHLLPPYLQGDNYILIATDISDLKQKEHELRQLVAKLDNHVKALRALRIDTICNTVDDVARKNKLEIANTKLFKEIQKLNRMVDKLKQKK